MPRRVIVILSLLFGLAPPSSADMPYPLNPRPCTAPHQPADCIPATQFSQYLFLPATTPPTLPNDWNDDDWKLTSEKTGDPEIDNNPQELFGVKGVSVDLAWQVSTGRPDVLIAVLDSGIEWQHPQPDLINKFHLNRGELPVPEGSTNSVDPYDRNGDGFFNIQDYLADGTHPQDSRISDQNGNGVIDPEDLIFIFSDGKDDDHNGYIDDICGWDFFEDDNDPLDEVEYGHGTGEAKDSNAEANNRNGDPGTCPSCMVMPVRVGDSFVADINNFAQGVLFATDSGARIIQEALGTLNNSSFAQAAVDYADAHGVAVIASAADEASDHHNYPANYNHTIEVNSVNHWNNMSGLDQTPHSYLYLNGCTNFGAHIAVSVESSSCSSEATGKSSGIAGLLYATALNEIDAGHLSPYATVNGGPPVPLSANEVKQLITMTADDINFDARPDLNPPLPQNYATSSLLPDVIQSERYHSIAGFDQYFGYGRINANTALRRVQAGTIPPEAEISAPDWFQVVNPDTGTFTITGRVAAVRADSYTYTVDVAPGVQPAEPDFIVVGQGSGSTPQQGALADLSLIDLAARMPHGVDGPAVDPQGLPDPDRFTVTVRVRIVDNLGNHGEDRRAFALHRDSDLAGGQPIRIGSDGGASPTLADLDGDGIEDIILATSDGLVHAYHGSTMNELPGWPVHADPIEVHGTAPAFASGLVPPTPFGAVLGSPAVGDLDHSGHLQVVVADLEGKLYVWESNGLQRAGFPVSTLADYSFRHRSERDLSTPDGRVPDRTNRHNVNNRLGRGFGAGPALGNLDGSADGSLEIVIGATDRHVYAWHADGSPVAGWPAMLKDPTKVQHVDPVTNEVTLTSNAKARYGTKIITPVSLGDLDGDGTLDVVAGVNEEYLERPNAIFENLILNFLRAGGALDSGNGRAYALFHDGTQHGTMPIDHGWNPDAFLPGWPVKIAMLTTELLPTVGSGQDGPPALADLDHDGRSEIGIFSVIGPAYIFRGDGTSFLGPPSPAVPHTLEADVFGSTSNSVDKPGYTGFGGGVLAEMGGAGNGFQFIAPGGGLGKLADNDLVAHQTPSDNLLGMWRVANADGTPGTGDFEPAFPRVVNDLQFLTAPSVGDLDGDGLPEALEGSGVYDVHAFNLAGVEPAGWPKFTGGWLIATPAIGDVDGDGRLDVVAITREGSLFVWKTAGGACGSVPWRKSHHDEWNTGNYDMDTRPPAAILPSTAALTSEAGGLVNLALTAVPGSDLYCGNGADFDVRFATQPITTAAQFAAATPMTLRSAPPAAGRTQQATLALQAPPPLTPGTVYIAAQVSDAAGNRSIVTALGQTTIEGGPTPTFAPTNTPTPSPTATITPTPTAGPVLAGDCSGTGTVTITDIVTLVNIDLGNAPESACPYGIPSGRQVDITLIIQAVGNALNG